MKTRLFVIVVIGFCFSLQFVLSQEFNPQIYFQKGNEFYSKGDFRKAVEHYEKILNSGYRSKDVLFNLGNCFYRLGEYHKSILYYERALILDPFDEDVRFNLQMAKLHNVDKIEEIPKFFLIQWWENIRDTLSSKQWAILGLISIWIASIALITFLFVFSSGTRKLLFGLGVFFIITFLFATILGISRYRYETNNNYAIVFSVNSYIKSSPEDGSTDLFILHQGTKVEILDEIGNWYKIRIANGNIGWIKKSDIERI
ncbi:MAG: tetratricopeptide repeat protein [Ignavibacteria bacterium]|nr:tetratricopeptide repeat protein [Ignavibacteria bacterium]